MAQVLGVDLDTGARVCHGKWTFEIDRESRIHLSDSFAPEKNHLYLTDGKARVLKAANGIPQVTLHRFGKGTGIYLSDFEVSPENNRMLLDLLLLTKASDIPAHYLSSNPLVEIAAYPEHRKLILLNNSEEAQETTVALPEGSITVSLLPLETHFLDY